MMIRGFSRSGSAIGTRPSTLSSRSVPSPGSGPVLASPSRPIPITRSFAVHAIKPVDRPSPPSENALRNQWLLLPTLQQPSPSQLKKQQFGSIDDFLELPNPALLENSLYNIECLAADTAQIPGDQILRQIQHLVNTQTCRLSEDQCARLLAVFKLAVQYGNPDPLELETAAFSLATGLIDHGMRPDLQTFGFVMIPPQANNDTGDNGRSLENYTFRILLDAYGNRVDAPQGAVSKAATIAEAWKLFDELKRSGKKPDFEDMSLLVMLMEKCKSVPDLERAFKETEALGLVAPGSSMLNLRIKGMQNVDPRRGLQLFEEARSAGARPNQMTFLAVLGCCGKLHDPERALKVFDDFTKKHNVKLGASCYVAMMDLMVECDMASGFSRVEKEMKLSGVPMSTKIWNVLILGNDRFHKGLEKAMAVFSEMRTHGDRPNEATLMALLNACYRRRDIDRAHQLFNSMRNEGVEVRLIHFLYLLQCAVESHSLDKFDKTVQLMKEFQIQCDRSLRFKISQQRAKLTHSPLNP